MHHKGYSASLEIDDEAGILFGEVLGLRDVITFQGETVAEARRSFEESVDFYLRIGADQGREPEPPFSGKFLVKVSPELHRSLSDEAQAKRVSLNDHVRNVLGEGRSVGPSERVPARASKTRPGRAR